MLVPGEAEGKAMPGPGRVTRPVTRVPRGAAGTCLCGGDLRLTLPSLVQTCEQVSRSRHYRRRASPRQAHHGIWKAAVSRPPGSPVWALGTALK